MPGATGVRNAALLSFAIAGLAGLVLVVLSQAWWLLAVGAAALAAGWFYTGGRRPYGYHGLGELFVFVFFGLVAVGGTVIVQVGYATGATWAAAVAIGALASAILVANNLRDLKGDAIVGKRTLATRLGDSGTRLFFAALLVVAMLAVVVVSALTTRWAMLGLVAIVLLAGPYREVLAGGTGPKLIRVLQLVGLGELATAAGLAVGLLIGA